MIRLPTSFSVPRILSFNQAKSGSIFSVLVYTSLDELFLATICYFIFKRSCLPYTYKQNSSLPTNSIIGNQNRNLHDCDQISEHLAG